jgi:hypothetical protein
MGVSSSLAFAIDEDGDPVISIRLTLAQGLRDAKA